MRRQIIALGKISSSGQRFRSRTVFQRLVTGIHDRLEIAFFAFRIRPHTILGRNAFHMLHFFLNQFKIFVREHHIIAFHGIVRIQRHLSARHTFQFVIDLAAHTVTDGDDQNHGSDTDNDTQHGENGAALVALDIHQGNLDVFPYLCHYYNLYLSCYSFPFSLFRHSRILR